MALPAAGRKRDRPGACRIAWSGVVRLSVFHHWAGSDATAAGAAGIAASLARGADSGGAGTAWPPFSLCWGICWPLYALDAPEGPQSAPYLPMKERISSIRSIPCWYPSAHSRRSFSTSRSMRLTPRRSSGASTRTFPSFSRRKSSSRARLSRSARSLMVWQKLGYSPVPPLDHRQQLLLPHKAPRLGQDHNGPVAAHFKGPGIGHGLRRSTVQIGLSPAGRWGTSGHGAGSLEATGSCRPGGDLQILGLSRLQIGHPASTFPGKAAKVS